MKPRTSFSGYHIIQPQNTAGNNNDSNEIPIEIDDETFCEEADTDPYIQRSVVNDIGSSNTLPRKRIDPKKMQERIETALKEYEELYDIFPEMAEEYLAQAHLKDIANILKSHTNTKRTRKKIEEQIKLAASEPKIKQHEISSVKIIPPIVINNDKEEYDPEISEALKELRNKINSIASNNQTKPAPQGHNYDTQTGKPLPNRQKITREFISINPNIQLTNPILKPKPKTQTNKNDVLAERLSAMPFEKQISIYKKIADKLKTITGANGNKDKFIELSEQLNRIANIISNNKLYVGKMLTTRDPESETKAIKELDKYSDQELPGFLKKIRELNRLTPQSGGTTDLFDKLHNLLSIISKTIAQRTRSRNKPENTKVNNTPAPSKHQTSHGYARVSVRQQD